jgi:TRAP-type C4-dicarboxylate transport system substrate-binding protein
MRLASLFRPNVRRLLLLLSLGWLLSACDSAPVTVAAVRTASVTVPGTPWYNMWIEFGDNLTAHPDNRLPVRHYIMGELGSEESQLSQLRRGRIQVGGYSLQGATSVIPELAVLLSPFLFESYDEVDFIMDEFLVPFFAEEFAARGMVLIAPAEVGWTSVYAKTPVMQPSDVAGHKIRSSKALSSQYLIESVGADMVPLPFPDIIPSLQTGLIHGGESGTVFYGIAGVAREAPHLTLTRHAFDTGVVVANRDWLEKLTAAQRQAILDSMPPARESRLATRASERDILENPTRYGVIVHQPGSEDLAAWRAATRDNHRRIIARSGPKAQHVYDLIQTGKAAFAASAATSATPTPMR